MRKSRLLMQEPIVDAQAPIVYAQEPIVDAQEPIVDAPVSDRAQVLDRDAQQPGSCCDAQG